MATQVQNRRGTTAEHSTFTGAVGELTVDTDKDTAVVHDGSTAGGAPLLREDGSNSALALGSAASPSLKFTGDTNTGIYSPGADQVAISTNGTGRLFVDSSGRVGVGTSPSTSLHVNGNARIGSADSNFCSIELGAGATGDRAAFIDLVGDTTYTDYGCRIERSSGGANGASRILHRGTGNFNLIAQEAAALAFWTTNTERLRITSDGKLGLGTSSPVNTLHVLNETSSGAYINYDGQSNTEYGLRIESNASGGNFESDFAVGSTALLDLYANSTSTTGGDFLVCRTKSATPVLLVKGNGNVGIGTTPGATTRLHVKSGANDGNPVLRLEAATNNNLDFRQTGSVFDINVTASDPLSFSIGSSEKARIDSSGRLLVGTSTSLVRAGGIQSKLQVSSTGSEASAAITRFAGASPGGPNFSLTKTRSSSQGTFSVVANGDTIGTFLFSADDGAAFLNAASIGAEVDGTPGANDMPGRLVFSTTADGASSPTERMRIDSSGNITAPQIYNNTTAAAANVHVGGAGLLYRSTSSGKYKTDVETLENPYADAILNCRPVWYRSTCEADNPNFGWWGFIAEEVAEIDPRLVHWKISEVTYDKNGSAVETPCDPEPEGVAYDRFVPHLLNLIKRQKEQIEAQGTALAALEARLSALEAA